MEPPSRRAVLGYMGTLGGLSLAGCLGDESLAYDVFQLGGTQTKPLWDHADSDRPGYLTLLASDEDEPWMVDDPADHEGLREWYTDTDFEESVVLYLQSIGLNSCYDELDVSRVADEGDRIAGGVTAVDTSDDDTACAEAITYPAAFVRVTGDDLPGEALFRITTGYGTGGIVSSDDRLVDPATLPGSIRPAGDPETVPEELSCADPAFERHFNPVDDDANLWWGDVEVDGETQFALRLLDTRDKRTRNENDNGGSDESENGESDEGEIEIGDAARRRFERGDELTIRLTNVHDGFVTTGNKHKYSLLVETEAGLEDVRGWTDGEPRGYTDEGVRHRPGTAFEWTIQLTEDGLLADHTHDDRLTVCPSLPAGRYWFVYWGLTGDRSVAVAFDYVD